MRKPIPFTLLVLLGLAVDLVTKWLAFRALDPTQMYPLIPDVLVLEHAENHGVAFSMLAGHSSIIIAITSIAITFIVWLYIHTYKKAHPLAIAAMGLLLIGATGNLIDRIMLGYVRDFIDFVPPIPVIGHWAVFNIADIAITVGVSLYAICEFFFAPKEEKAPAV
jgi:signal peptidase II